jgi:phosphate starvation-inducible PhoH-like protein
LSFVKKPSVEKLTLEETVDVAALYGSFDAHLRMIEEAFSVRVMARGHDITLTGTIGGVRQARRVLLDLASRSENGMELTREAVARAILVGSAPLSPAPEVIAESTPEAIPVFGKRRTISPKGPAQAAYIESVRKSDIVIGIGPAGTGKTYLAMAMAISAFHKKEVSRIVLTRPAVEAGEKLGFLPGDLFEKVHPYLRPMYDALYDMMDAQRATHLIEHGDIEIAPLAFMRGRTMSDAFVILDEAQNTTSEQMKMFLTRLGPHSRAVITGDITQIDLPADQTSGLVEIQTVLKSVAGIQFIYFTDQDIIRHRLVREIVNAYARHRKKR